MLRQWVRNAHIALLNTIPGWHLAVLEAFFRLPICYLVRKSNRNTNAFAQGPCYLNPLAINHEFVGREGRLQKEQPFSLCPLFTL